MANTSKYRVLKLRDPREPDLPRFVQAARRGESPWKAIWDHRDEIDNRLTKWFRELSASGVLPQEATILGRCIGLSEATARALAAFCLEDIAIMAGSYPELPNFILNEPINRGGRGRNRQVVRIDGDGKLTRFASLRPPREPKG